MVNWVRRRRRIAISQLGGPATAARKLGVDRMTVDNWTKADGPGLLLTDLAIVRRIVAYTGIDFSLLASVGREEPRFMQPLTPTNR